METLARMEMQNREEKKTLLENKKPIKNGHGVPLECRRHALVRRCYVDGNCYLCSHLPLLPSSH